MTLERGTLLYERYRIVEILGQGGMGSVYRAVDENLGVDVAVKENLFTTEEYSRQFRLEAVILAGLRHANLPRVSDHFSVGDQGQYLVMDFIEGEDLRQRMERLGTVPEEDTIMVGAAMCDALTYLHTRKPSILHRDLKPGNVRISPDGSIFLVDFGLVKLVQGPQATTTGARAMTPGYSPPEQYGGARTDPRTDVYSLGATLYAALSGVIPEDGLARAMDNVRLTPLRRRNPSVSRRVAAAIEKAMAVDPADRFQTAEDFKKALLAAASRGERPTGEFTVAPPPDVPPPLAALMPSAEGAETASALKISKAASEPAADQAIVSPHSRGRSPAWLFFLFAFIVALSGIIILLPEIVPENLRAMLPALGLDLTATSLPAEVVLPPETATQGSGITTMTATLRVSPTLSRTGAPTAAVSAEASPAASLVVPPPSSTLQQIAFASDRSGIPQIYMTDLSGSAAVPITNLPDGACQPSWSPDGTRLVFVSPCHVSPEGRPVDISEGPPDDTALYMLNADGSNLVALPTAPGGDSEPAWSPDGQRLAFTSLRDGQPLIYVMNLMDQSVKRLTEPSPDYAAARQPAWSPFGNQIAFAKKRVDTYQIWTVTDAGQGQQPISRGGQQFWDFFPAWTPDGKTVLFTERNAEGPVLPWIMSILYEMRDSASSVRLELGPLPVERPQVSPDGLLLAFEGKGPDENRDIFYTSLSGAQRTRITTDPGIDFDPTWRPPPAP
jgi:serine/threonine protein kinase/Tol biopolymer transport system component